MLFFLCQLYLEKIWNHPFIVRTDRKPHLQATHQPVLLCKDTPDWMKAEAQCL